MWGGVFSTIDCSLAHLRKKEDPWNSIASGALTGGILAVRQGTGTMIGSAIIGSSIYSIIYIYVYILDEFLSDKCGKFEGEMRSVPF